LFVRWKGSGLDLPPNITQSSDDSPLTIIVLFDVSKTRR
jgi:hypothetical protein